jgi:hypothetical protein
MTQEPITDKTLSEAEKEVINEDPDYKEYQEIDLQVLLKSGTSTPPIEKFGFRFHIYSTAQQPHNHEAKVQILNLDINDQRDINKIDPTSYAGFISFIDGNKVTWDIITFGEVKTALVPPSHCFYLKRQQQ